MPRKVRPPADTAQNRENQQRSRARRREYLTSLEARVRDFENREARATLEMQRAAREVAWVNERLMELLASKGVAREEVDEFLRRAGEDGVAAASGHAQDQDHTDSAIEGTHDDTTILHAIDDGRVADSSDGTPRLLKRGAGNADEGLPALVTSCDDAANIIANFQGHGDVSQARNALGCGDAADCHVKNTRLFQLMDEAGCP
ncbi:hypothetical protein F4808DRAFT_316825 [Astrocystis sublimbata]|nr:hypothetical protein F4808DRAFT_316825 [Astrocystis sublimbata]